LTLLPIANDHYLLKGLLGGDELKVDDCGFSRYDLDVFFYPFFIPHERSLNCIHSWIYIRNGIPSVLIGRGTDILSFNRNVSTRKRFPRTAVDDSSFYGTCLCQCAGTKSNE
jgi:hypothetical protein